MAGFVEIVTDLRGSNCGFSSEAWYKVRQYTLQAEIAELEHPHRIFDVTSPTAQEREYLEFISGSAPTASPRYLVSPLPYRPARVGPRRLVIVCDTAYRDQPREILFTAPPTHAAGYSDGSVRLISTIEFAKLDRSFLVPLDELLAAPKN